MEGILMNAPRVFNPPTSYPFLIRVLFSKALHLHIHTRTPNEHFFIIPIVGPSSRTVLPGVHDTAVTKIAEERSYGSNESLGS